MQFLEIELQKCDITALTLDKNMCMCVKLLRLPQ